VHSPEQIKNFIITAVQYSLIDEDYKKLLTNKIETEYKELIFLPTFRRSVIKKIHKMIGILKIVVKAI